VPFSAIDVRLITRPDTEGRLLPALVKQQPQRSDDRFTAFGLTSVGQVSAPILSMK
jgi:hypothetical protein